MKFTVFSRIHVCLIDVSTFNGRCFPYQSNASFGLLSATTFECMSCASHRTRVISSRFHRNDFKCDTTPSPPNVVDCVAADDDAIKQNVYIFNRGNNLHAYLNCDSKEQKNNKKNENENTKRLTMKNN